MDEEKAPDFDFDLWSQLAQQEPEKFEALRQQMIDDLITQSPLHLRQRMTGLQWQVDQIRRQASNPMAACLQISQKMWANVLGDNGLLKVLQEPKEILKSLENAPTAKVLSFGRSKPDK